MQAVPTFSNQLLFVKMVIPYVDQEQRKESNAIANGKALLFKKIGSYPTTESREKKKTYMKQ